MSSDVGARRHSLARCEECSLNVPGVAFVPSQQPTSGEVKLVIVGEAPGYQEGKTGIPFTGPSGRLLETVLRGHGLRREDAFITNACLCRPRDNATPSASNVDACSERLYVEVAEASSAGAPIVALGNVAASAIFGTKVAITSFRVGPAKESHIYPGTRVIPTVHPAYVLRQADAFPLFAGDIGKVNHDISIRWEAPQFAVFDDQPSACRALRELQETSRDLVVDIEVGSEKDEQFVHPDQYQLLCVGFSYSPGHAIVIGEAALRSGRRDGQSGVRHMLRRTLENQRARIIAHNGKFDLAGLSYLAPRATLGFDTMLASYAVDERPGTHGLKYLAQEKLGAPNYALEMHKYLDRDKHFGAIPREILYKYNAHDVVCTYLLKDMYESTMSSDERRVHDMLVRASNMLMPAEMKGITVDTDYLELLEGEFSQELANLEDVLAYWVENPRSPLQVKNALAKLGLSVQSTNVATLDNILYKYSSGALYSEEIQNFVMALKEHRKGTKMYGTYIKGIMNRLYRGHVHPTFLLHGTSTGRLSCRNPNLQNVPRDSKMKRMFIPTPGRIFVQADYKGAELRVLACESRDQYLRQLFRDDRDIHNEVAARFFGPGFTKDQRVRAKAVVFGLAYGREAYSLSEEYKISVDEAQGYLDTFFSMIPEVVAFREKIKNEILHGEEDLVTHFGRHRRVWLVTDDNQKDVVKESLAFMPQSTASDICLTAACVLHEQYGLDIRLLVHDSILVECDPKEVELTAEIMNRVMPQVASEVYSDYVPWPVDVAIGGSWAL
jgi:DNA polymerase-1